MSSGLKVPFGRQGELLVAPSDALATGLACNCTCPGCGARLMLRRGSRRCHFAHYNAPVKDTCVSQAIHAAAIQVLLQAKHVLLPYHSIGVRRYTPGGQLVERYVELCQERTVRFDECRAEVTVQHAEAGAVRPDVVGYRGDRQLFVEMWYTHQVDDEKKGKLKTIGVPAIEIWLQDLDLEAGLAAIERRVLSEPLRHWLYYPGEEEIKCRLEIEVAAEVARLAEMERRKREWAQRRQEARHAEKARRDRTALNAALQQRRTEEACYLQFRQRPVQERELTLRLALGIKGPWPYYLRLANRNNAAIDAPHRLWQAAVFYHFVFGKPPMVHSFGIMEVANWVRNWFGVTHTFGYDSLHAVKALLFYLSGCGFLEYAGPGTGGKFTVLHNALAPPPKKERTASPNLVTGAKASLAAPVYRNISRMNERVTWSWQWPDQESVREVVTKWKSMSQRDELKILDALGSDGRDALPTPLEFATLMAREMPLTLVLNFLRNHGFVE